MANILALIELLYLILQSSEGILLVGSLFLLVLPCGVEFIKWMIKKFEI